MAWWHRRERGPELRLSAAETIPADRMIAFLEFRRPDEFVRILESTPVVANLTKGGAENSFQTWRDELFEKYRILEKAPSYLGATDWSDGLSRIIGDSVTLVVLDLSGTSSIDLSSEDKVDRGRPAVLLWLRPNLGWRGELATMLAPMAGGSKVDSSRSDAGARFFTYRDPKHPERGLAWTRLGSTFLVRLDSADPAPFERILDWAESREAADKTDGGTAASPSPQPPSAFSSPAAPPLAALPDFRAMAEFYSRRPGLWGLARGPRAFDALDPLLPGGLDRWIDPAWRPALESRLAEYPLVQIGSDFSTGQGLYLTLRWLQDPETDASPDAVGESLAAAKAGVAGLERDTPEPRGEDAGSLTRLRAESGRVSEVIQWITLITRSVEQVTEAEEAARDEKEESGESTREAIAQPALTPDEKALRKQERKLQKERRRALLKELTDPLRTARIVSALGPWVELDIATAGLSSRGSWKPDWDFTASGGDDSRLRQAAAGFFSAVERREPAAALHRLDPGGPQDSPAASPLGPPIRAAKDILSTTATLAMDLRDGRFLVRIPGDGTLRIGVHRHPLPGEVPSRSTTLSDSDSAPASRASSSGVGANADSTPDPTSASKPAVSLTVDWPRLAAHLDRLIVESADNPRLPEVRQGVVLFRDWASALARAGRSQFVILSRPEGALWVLHVPLAP